MLFDEQSDQVRLTQAELNRIRKHAAQNGEVIGQITNTEQLDDALVKACSTNELEKLIEDIEAHIKPPK